MIIVIMVSVKMMMMMINSINNNNDNDDNSINHNNDDCNTNNIYINRKLHVNATISLQMVKASQKLTSTQTNGLHSNHTNTSFTAITITPTHSQ